MALVKVVNDVNIYYSVHMNHLVILHKYTLWSKLCVPLTIRPICGSFPNCPECFGMI